MVLDIGLPGMDGLSILQKWRGNALQTPVLILTARDGWSHRVDGLDAGADDYLTNRSRCRSSRPVSARSSAVRRARMVRPSSSWET